MRLCENKQVALRATTQDKTLRRCTPCVLSFVDTSFETTQTSNEQKSHVYNSNTIQFTLVYTFSK